MTINAFDIERPTASKKEAPAFEWQTCLLVIAVYGCWFGCVDSFAWLPMPVATGLLIMATCWTMSLQHELIHGHPTRHRSVNRLLGLAPLAVWYPYDLYRSGHLAHHRNELLTQPGIDPESNYIDADDFAALPRWARPLWTAQRTSLGRLLIGPAFVIVPTWLDIVRKPWRGDFSETLVWAQHLGLTAIMLWALERFAGISPLYYLLAVSYPALGIAMLRSFHEHRPADDPAHRVVVNEAGFGWRLLFLNNNYHAVHHEDCSLPWYRIRRAYLQDRTGVLQRNGGFLVTGYGRLLARHAVKPVDSPVHTAIQTSATAR
jgi:fatty acid desaturase